jgi:hypothetical protein
MKEMSSNIAHVLINLSDNQSTIYSLRNHMNDFYLINDNKQILPCFFISKVPFRTFFVCSCSEYNISNVSNCLSELNNRDYNKYV